MSDLILSYAPTLHLIYSTPDFPLPDQLTLTRRLQASSKETPPKTVQVNWQIRNNERALGDIQFFGSHQVHLAGLANPLPPEVLDQTIHTSLWQPQIKASMRQHLSHLSLVYTGAESEPIEKMVALYQTAHAFENENLLGVVNPQAWTAHPPADFLSPKKIDSYRHQIPFILWMGYVKFFIDKQHYWLVSKGHHIFDVPDLAYFIQPGETSGDIINLFINIFYYIFEQDITVTAGDSLTIGEGGTRMRFSEVSEYPELLLGPSGTLVIEKITSQSARD